MLMRCNFMSCQLMIVFIYLFNNTCPLFSYHCSGLILNAEYNYAKKEMYVSIYIYIYIYIYTYIHIHIHTHTFLFFYLVVIIVIHILYACHNDFLYLYYLNLRLFSANIDMHLIEYLQN